MIGVISSSGFWCCAGFIRGESEGMAGAGSFRLCALTELYAASDESSKQIWQAEFAAWCRIFGTRTTL
jgi:hypothetical protein